MNKKPKILVIENAVDVTGSLHSIIRSSVLLKEQFSFEFILPIEGSAASIMRARGFKTWVIPMRELRRDPISVLCYLPVLFVNTFRYLKILKSVSASLVVNNDFYNLIPVVAATLRSRIPYVCYVRFMPSKFPRLLSSLWFGLHNRFASSIITVSETVKRDLPFSEKTAVIYNEAPDESVSYFACFEQLILFPANYIKGKGQEDAIDAWSRIVSSNPTWILRFVGGDMGLAKNKAFKASLIKRAEELNLTQNIEFLDFSDNLAQHYLESSFVLNFSESESFSLTTLEAQFYGRPVIVTRCGGPEEIIIDGETGILVPIKGIDAMVNAIAYLITHPAERNQMGARAYTHVREKFSPQNTIEKLAQIYRSAIIT